jgi:hypothetical protein
MVKVSIDPVLTKAQQVVMAWEMNSDFKLGTMTLEEFKVELQKLITQVEASDRAKLAYADLVNSRDQQASTVNDLVTRARSGFRAYYGPDSSQYEMVGGKRRSDRKSPVRGVR